eukprot:TRINITY_DN699_c0_g4_i1.p1 TRINITY_DN699_c0_g4~~TRINITY_DN699_c0_g4_i1.p1  ORF type:complete len:345 (-),score=136.56 TRINITY_DN699_c0_g4_i1:219-1253(-)
MSDYSSTELDSYNEKNSDTNTNTSTNNDDVNTEQISIFKKAYIYLLCPWSKGTWIRIGAIVTVFATILILVAIFYPEIEEFMKVCSPDDVDCVTGAFPQFIIDLGPWGPIVFTVVYIFWTVALLPGSLLTIAAGAIFIVLSPNPGAQIMIAFATVSAGSTIGASFAFLLGKFLVRSWAEKKMELFPKFKSVEAAIGKRGLTITFLLRLSPVIPFNILNYLLGITSINFFSYVIASWVGMMPGTFLYVYIGWLLGQAISGTSTTSTLQSVLLYGVGTVATIAVVVIVTIIAKRQITRALEEEEQLKNAESNNNNSNNNNSDVSSNEAVKLLDSVNTEYYNSTQNH